MNTFCPDCHRPTEARANAREGRCDWCRPRRQHSKPRKSSQTNFARFLEEFGQRRR